MWNIVLCDGDEYEYENIPFYSFAQRDTIESIANDIAVRRAENRRENEGSVERAIFLGDMGEEIPCPASIVDAINNHLIEVYAEECEAIAQEERDSLLEHLDFQATRL